MEPKEKNTADASTEKSPVENQKTPEQQKAERLERIDKELGGFNEKAKSPEEIKNIENERSQHYQQKVDQLENVLGPLGDESKRLVQKGLVRDVIEQANKENDRLDFLQEEKKKLILYNNLELGNNAQEQIEKARNVIEFQDETGEKTKIFNEALEYYSEPKEEIADVPINHGGSAFALHRIIKEGALDSSKNVLGGEAQARSETHGGTSFALGKYEEAEVISRIYARKAEKNSSLVIDSNDFLGVEAGQGRAIIDAIHHQLPKLKPEERKFIEEELRKVDKNKTIDFYKSKDFIFDYDKACKELQESKEKIMGKRGEITDTKYLEYLGERIPELEKQIESFNKLNDQERELLQNPYGIVLVYEGRGLPEKDLKTFTTAGISERRTKESIPNYQLKQLYAPQEKISQVKGWLDKKVQELPLDSEERKALEKVKMIPMEYLEVKNLVKKI